MQIKKNTVVSLNYQVFDTQGELLDKSEQPLVYLHGGYDGIFPQVEEALHDQHIGASVDVLMEPENAFGDFDESLIHLEDASLFPDDLAIGMTFETEDADGDEGQVFTVTDIADGKVVLDGNHPFAGKTLRFQGTVVDVRDATPEELRHGHAHEEGHHHD